jgi:hypothetical protein
MVFMAFAGLWSPFMVVFMLILILDLQLRGRHGVAQHPLESGIGSFGAVSVGSSRCASGS